MRRHNIPIIGDQSKFYSGLDISDRDVSNWQMDGTDENGQTKWVRRGGAASNPPQTFGQMQQGGGGMSSGSLSGMSGSFGGKNPFATDAAAAKLKGEYDRIRKRSAGRLNEDSMARGTFSSGVAGDLMSQEMNQLDLGDAAGLEDLYNRASQQEMAFALEQQRMQNELARQGSNRYGSANENSDLMAMFQQLMGGGGGGSLGGGTTYGASQAGGGMQQQSGSGGGMGPDPRGMGSMELARAYYRATGKYGTPADQRAWAEGIWGGGGAKVDASKYLA